MATSTLSLNKALNWILIDDLDFCKGLRWRLILMLSLILDVVAVCTYIVDSCDHEFDEVISS